MAARLEQKERAALRPVAYLHLDGETACVFRHRKEVALKPSGSQVSAFHERLIQQMGNDNRIDEPEGRSCQCVACRGGVHGTDVKAGSAEPARVVSDLHGCRATAQFQHLRRTKPSLVRTEQEARRRLPGHRSNDESLKGVGGRRQSVATIGALHKGRIPAVRLGADGIHAGLMTRDEPFVGGVDVGNASSHVQEGGMAVASG